MSVVFEKMHSPSALSFPLAVLCDDAALTLDFEHSQGRLLGILKLGIPDSGLGFADNLDESCFCPYAYILNAGCAVEDILLSLSG